MFEVGIGFVATRPNFADASGNFIGPSSVSRKLEHCMEERVNLPHASIVEELIKIAASFSECSVAVEPSHGPNDAANDESQTSEECLKNDIFTGRFVSPKFNVLTTDPRMD